MSSPLIRLVREELSTKNIQLVTPSKLVEVRGLIDKAFSGLSINDPRSRRMIQEFIQNIEQDIELLAKTRLVKAILNDEELPESFDKELLEHARRLVKAERAIQSVENILVGEKYLVVLLKDCVIGGRSYRKGDVTLMGQSGLVEGILQDCISVVKHPVVEELGEKS
ncbi:MAG: hypothetical protein QXW45_02400 [Thermosphaera sp.]